MKKIIIILVAAILGWQLWKNEKVTSNKVVTVGILQVVEHPALDETRRGITDHLEKKAKLNHVSLKIVYESAQNNTALASQIAQNYVGRKVDVIVTLGTTATQTAIRAAQGTEIPVVFSSVSDPIHAKIVGENAASNFVTGVSNFVSPKTQLKYFKSLFPHIKKIGILYNPGEDNSVVMKEKTEQAIKDFGLELQSASANKISEVASAADRLASTCDAIFINNDNTALSAIESVARVCHKNNILLLSSDLVSFKQGADAAVGPDQYVLGEQTALMVWRVVEKNDPLSKINFEIPHTLFISAKTSSH